MALPVLIFSEGFVFDALVKPFKVANVKIGFLIENKMDQSFFLGNFGLLN